MAFSKEEAATRLASVEVAAWQDELGDRLSQLPRPLRSAAERLLVPEVRSSYHHWQDLTEWLDLTATERHRIFESAAPGRGDLLAATWNLAGRLPYQVGWHRRSFRVDDRRELTLARQVQSMRAAAYFTNRYDADAPWLAAWAGHLGHGDLGPMLAAAIESHPRGDEVIATILDVLAGTHPFGVMSQHHISALLIADRPDGWEAVGRLLVAAQRQEGLRQTILEAIDQGHPGAFAHLLSVVVEHDLERFAATIRAVGVWFGVSFDVLDRTIVERLLTMMERGLRDPTSARAAIGSDDPIEVYTGLWCVAVRSVTEALALAEPVVVRDDPMVRLFAAHFVAELGLPESQPMLHAAMEDPDRAVAARAFLGIKAHRAADAIPPLEVYLDRVGGSPATLEPHPWLPMTVSPTLVVGKLLEAYGEERVLEARKHVPLMDADTRARYARLLSQAVRSPERRDALVELAGDRSSYVRQVTFEAIKEERLRSEDAPTIEAMLTRTAAATRMATIDLLLTLPDRDVTRSIERLIGSKNKQQRLGGIDLIRQMIEQERLAQSLRELASVIVERPRISADEQDAIAPLLDDPEEVASASADDGFGLFDPADLRPVVQPVSHKVKLKTNAHAALLQSADALVERYADTPFMVERYDGTSEMLYGNAGWALMPHPGRDPEQAPLAEVWEEWWAAEQPSQADLVRTLVMPHERETYRHAHGSLAKLALAPLIELNYPTQVRAAMWWLWVWHGTTEGVDLLLDAAESGLATVPASDVARPVVETRTNWGYVSRSDWRQHSPLMALWSAVNRAASLRPDLMRAGATARRWELASWLDRLAPAAPRSKPEPHLLIAAFDAGVVGRAEVIDFFVGVSGREVGGRWSGVHRGLAEATTRTRSGSFAEHPELLAIADEVRSRVVEVELTRGDPMTDASRAALAIRGVPGAARLVALVAALGRGTLQRGWAWNAENKNSTLSHLIRVSYPDETDTPAHFAELAADAGLKEQRLVDIALYAPQWARYVEHAIGWEGLEDAVYWLHAHTKDKRWSVEQDIRDMWMAEIATRTPLRAELLDGAVDVEWFKRMIEVIGDERWAQLLKSAKYTSGGGGHKRAESFAKALRGELGVEAVVKRIVDKRHQDTVRALGLIPLDGDADLQQRFAVMEEFRRGSRKFGSQRQASEKRAVEVGLENLARTAAYADPLRLQWDMEIAATEDLVDGPMVVERDDYRIELSVDELGQPQTAVSRAGKKLKNVPAKHRKDPQVVELRARATDLRRQVSRVRRALDDASVRGDTFSQSEVQRLFRHPVIRPMLTATILVGDGGALGIPQVDGSFLAPSGTVELPAEELRLAHPVDLLGSDEWSDWQHFCFVNDVRQPFKQVFRELYVLTEAESSDGKKSERYAGHQLNPRQAAGVFGSRGWVTHPDGFAFKVFYREGLQATVLFDGAPFTPAEVDGSTIGPVYFQSRNEPGLTDLAKIPPRLFSEAMRDLDLVVSTAHMGGVDPEASASTVEMRRTLVRETAMALGLDNVRFASSHVVVDGTLGSYTIHLGSAQVHRQPGGALCIIPVGSQHRGRLFLPFADDDPRTAEVVSKVVLLAKDDEIKDPTILSQLV